MNTFKRKSLYAALAGVSALGATTAVEAVNINPDGLGQVLLYPYYTVRSDSKNNAFVTGLSVINTTTSVKAVKVRFLEGKASTEVLDFNLYLSPNDVWTAAITPTSQGAQIITFDNSCTVPAIPSGGQPFVNFAYAGDPATASLDRTREGYFEIIEMGVVTNVTVANAATHNSIGLPNNCAVVRSDTNNPSVNPPTGGLFGGETLINVNAGTDYTADPVPLDNFSSFNAIWNSPGSILPNLTNVSPAQSTVFQTVNVSSNPNGAFVVTTGGPGGWGTSFGSGSSIDNVSAVSAVLMHDNVFNEYVLDAATQSGTDWVITFPTKRFYYDYVVNVIPGVTVPVQLLFQRNFVSSGACDDIASTIFDREEKGTLVLAFSPPQPGGFSLCWEANVLTFNGGSVLGSQNVSNIATTNSNGWLKIGFPQGNGSGTIIANNHRLSSTATPTLLTALSGATSTNQSATYFGLPAIGFSVNSYTNGTLVVNGVTTLSAYGGNFINKASRNIKSP